MDDKIKQILRLSKAVMKSHEFMDSTVDRINEDALIEAAYILEKRDCFISIGVKNTASIKRKYIKNLMDKGYYVWNTIDNLSDGGRAIDVKIPNPITGKPMTGSSSCTAINVLYGINDVGIGTDGGGSVLAPALSLNLFSILAKGMGLKGNSKKKSTDGIDFQPGIGVMSCFYNKAESCIKDMLSIDGKYKKMYNHFPVNMTVAVPKHKNIILPDGSDMRDHLSKFIRSLKNMHIKVREEVFPDFSYRKDSIEITSRLLEKYDVLATYEGPVDFYGIGDSVFGSLGRNSREIQNNSGKYMVKIANMIDSTAVTIPVDEFSSGIVLATGKGLESGMNLLKLCSELTHLYHIQELYYKYFYNSCFRKKKDIIFSLEGI